MNLPRDIIIHILSYIDNQTIKNIEMPYDYYKKGYELGKLHNY